MFEREVFIASLRKEQNALRELIEELEDETRLHPHEADYCGEVLKKIERTLKALRRRPIREHRKYVL